MDIKIVDYKLKKDNELVLIRDKENIKEWAGGISKYEIDNDIVYLWKLYSQSGDTFNEIGNVFQMYDGKYAVIQNKLLNVRGIYDLINKSWKLPFRRADNVVIYNDLLFIFDKITEDDNKTHFKIDSIIDFKTNKNILDENYKFIELEKDRTWTYNNNYYASYLPIYDIKSGEKGLYDIYNRKIVIPCNYNEIVINKSERKKICDYVDVIMIHGDNFINKIQLSNCGLPFHIQWEDYDDAYNLYCVNDEFTWFQIRENTINLGKIQNDIYASYIQCFNQEFRIFAENNDEFIQKKREIFSQISGLAELLTLTNENEDKKTYCKTKNDIYL